VRSLFARILLWFLATIIVTAVGQIVISNLNRPVERRPFPSLSRLMLTEARSAYESGGKEALAAYLQYAFNATGVRGALTDNSGKDLLTGEERPAAGRGPRPGRPMPPWLPLRAGPPPSLSVTDGQYRFVMLPDRPGPGPWVFLPQQIWALFAALALCYGLAVYLTAPLRHLQKAVERFGKGDFTARAASTRRDELGDLARTFDRMAGRIQTLLEAERRLLLDISHEVRSPLARLGVAVELARSGADAESALNRIQREADRLNTLVGELLQITRAEGDPGALRARPVRLDALLQDLAEDCAIEAQDRGAALRIAAPEPVSAQGDSELLRRAIENVIRNAIRFAPPGTCVEVDLSKRPGGAALIQVRDYGPGVPEESLERIFDAFYRVEAHRDRESGGVGLGLAIARRAIELHQGSIRARNAHPGLLMEIEVPLAVPAL
jgi:two-component system sensor histidine kinase CpxA